MAKVKAIMRLKVKPKDSTTGCATAIKTAKVKDSEKLKD